MIDAELTVGSNQQERVDKIFAEQSVRDGSFLLTGLIAGVELAMLLMQLLPICKRHGAYSPQIRIINADLQLSVTREGSHDASVEHQTPKATNDPEIRRPSARSNTARQGNCNTR